MPQAATPRSARTPRRWRGLLWLGAALALAATAAAYLNPHFVVDLATRAWSCF